MPDRADGNGWERLAGYGSRIEAEFVAETLRGAGIPVMIDGPDVGLFGPGFSGGSVHGIQLLVPAEWWDEACGIAGITDSADGALGPF